MITEWYRYVPKNAVKLQYSIKNYNPKNLLNHIFTNTTM